MKELNTYDLEFGRFGAYYRDLITGKELDLNAVRDLLNKPSIEISKLEELIEEHVIMETSSIFFLNQIQSLIDGAKQ